MLIIQTTKQFEKDYKKIFKSGQKDMEKIKKIMTQLANSEQLEEKHRDHILIGNHIGRRECHIESDWLLIYRFIDEDKIRFERTGSHSELFS
ncbi:MAG TPA: type II toxin-antitoxin system YafQ family toxin [Spirochaetota bacterium]|jgi:mRNA interferase YafQ|nr:MAG: mRNA interferase YafQ [Spirochaetes bacterium ADurb.Bin133]HNZ26850.1 type II toxin-antitoxin system YafQ family toxin [Spirochaetota bacterium]HPY86591.1 type II toxin-antitoxin system YafQ family toxin [Spirochaetota bacterium]HQB60219.1 type II toxin-antitoxin system YafQ family toxin [Spirochaetota bacterium]